MLPIRRSVCALTLALSPFAQALPAANLQNAADEGREVQILPAKVSQQEADAIQKSVADAQVNRVVKPTAEPEPNINFDPSVLNDPNNYFRQNFDLIVLINKASRAETIDVYRFGKWVKHGNVSSGREVALKDNGKWIFTQTFTGFFTPQRGSLSIDHHSQQFDDAHMPYAVFFNNGEATHQAPPGTEKALGHRASHGCVRNTEANAADIFWMVALSGGPFKAGNFAAWCRLSKPEAEGILARNGKSGLDAANASLRQACQGDQSWNNLTDLYQAQAQHALEVGANEGFPYKTWPQVPDVDRATGMPLHDAAGKMKTHLGYRALYIVENVEPTKGQPINNNGPTGLVVADASLLVSANPDARYVRLQRGDVQQDWTEQQSGGGGNMFGECGSLDFFGKAFNKRCQQQSQPQQIQPGARQQRQQPRQQYNPESRDPMSAFFSRLLGGN